MTDDYTENPPYSQAVLRRGRLTVVEPVASIRAVQPPIKYVGCVDVAKMPYAR